MMRIEQCEGERYWVDDLDVSDFQVLREIYEDHTYRALPVPGYRILDIGAHKGVFTIWAAKRGAIVTSYEPNPFSFEIMQKNAELNGVKLDAHSVGIWSRRDTLPFYPYPFSAASSTFIHTPKQRDLLVMADVIPLDEAIGDEEWDFLKIDVEGAEGEIILASDRLLQVKQISIEVHTGFDWRCTPAMYDKLNNLFEHLPSSKTEVDSWVRKEGK